jgi:sugar lactone lactonase YvrE
MLLTLSKCAMAAADTIWTVDKPWLQTQCALGEGPFFEKQTNSLRFVDVLRKQILNVCLSDGSPVQPPIVLDVVATVTSDIEGIDPREKILVGLKYGIAVLDRRIGSYSIITRFHKPSIERLRSNDGAADPLGRFWLGSMTDFGYGDFLYEGKAM